MNEIIKVTITIPSTDSTNEVKIELQYPSYPVGVYKDDISMIMSSIERIFEKKLL